MAYGIRMHVGGRDLGWNMQDGKPLLFSEREEAEQHASVLNARPPAASYVVTAWPTGVGRQEQR